MKALVFAAGHGTRLSPLTDSKPKALVELNRVTLLELAIKKLVLHGFTQIVINVHAFGDQIIDFIKKHSFDAQIFISDEREMLLDTGGGLMKSLPFFDDSSPFLVYNVDIITTANLKMFYEEHMKNRPLVSLLVRKRETSRMLIFDSSMKLEGWENSATNEKIWVNKPIENGINFAFSGIHIVDPCIEKFKLPEDASFPIIPFYLKIAKEENIMGVEDADSVWFDVGKIDQLNEAEAFLSTEKYPS